MVSLIIRVIAIIAAAAAIAGWFLTNGKVAELQDTVAKAQEQKQQAESRANDLESEINLYDAKIKAKDSELADSKGRATKLNSQLVQARREISNLQEKVTKGESEKEELENKNTALRREILEKSVELPSGASEEEVEAFKTEIASLEGQVSSLREKLRTAEDRLLNAAPSSGSQAATTTASTGSGSSNRLNSITAKKRPTGILAPVEKGDTAAILKIDHRNSLVVVSLGQNRGYANNMEFSILKDYNRPVRVRIKDAKPSFSIASILPGKGNPRSLQEGDTVNVIQ